MLSACRDLAAVSRMLFQRDLTELNGGNLSMRSGRWIIATPTYAAEYYHWDLSPGRFIIFDSKFRLVRGREDAQSRDTELHRLIYAHNPRVGSIIHLHTDIMITMPSYTGDGYLRALLEKNGIALHTYEQDIKKATREEQYRLNDEIIAKADKRRTNIIVLPRHGILAVSETIFKNYRDIDIIASGIRHLIIKRTLGRIP